jgi:hypothetical protein
MWAVGVSAAVGLSFYGVLANAIASAEEKADHAKLLAQSTQVIEQAHYVEITNALMRIEKKLDNIK